MTGTARESIPLEKVETLDGLFRARVAASPKAAAYRYFDTTNKAWLNLSWQQMAEQVARWQTGLAGLGLQEGDRVALGLRNCPEWVMFEQAAIGLGLVVIPLYTDDRADNIAFILGDAGVRLLLLPDAARWRRLAPALAANHTLQHVVLLNGECESIQTEDPRLICRNNLLPDGDHALQGTPQDPQALATIVYTSGTTGRPKGVMLSHRNILSNTIASQARAPLDDSDLLLSFLPLAHMYERTGGYYLAMLVGAQVCYARSIARLNADLLEQRPTAFFSVPRIFERVQAKLDEQLSKASPLHRALFKLAINAGWRRFKYQQGHASWHPLQLIAPLTQRLVGDKVLAKLGGRLRFVGSGGAPLSTTIAHTFIGLGVPLFQGYGMTEASPIICGNVPGANDPETIGPALDGIEIKLGENDELLVRGPNVMLGYWNRPEATAEVIDSDGWLHTGDQAAIDARGYVRITGRIKDIIVLSNGEKVPPADMELAISGNPLFEQVMVIGEARPYLAALIVLNKELWPELAQQCKIDDDSADALQNKVLNNEVQKLIAEQLRDFPGYARIRRVYLTLKPWSIENDLLTPTLKIKRAGVMTHLHKEIEQLYSNGKG